jgi:hypothetical protein
MKGRVEQAGQRPITGPGGTRPAPAFVASSLDDEVDLNAGPKWQRGHRDRRAGGKGGLKYFA